MFGRKFRKQHQMGSGCSSLWLAFYRFLLPIDLELNFISLLFHTEHSIVSHWMHCTKQYQPLYWHSIENKHTIQQNEVFVVAFIFFSMNKNVESTQLHRMHSAHTGPIEYVYTECHLFKTSQLSYHLFHSS